MTLAWNVKDIPFDGLKSFFTTTAEREFGQELAGDVAHIWHERNEANEAAASALALFDQDFDLSEEYHRQLDGKWNHMMMQPHYGYEETWHAPSRDMIGGLSHVQSRQDRTQPLVRWALQSKAMKVFGLVESMKCQSELIRVGGIWSQVSLSPA
ncbi:hypothetical protein QQZ08_008774 [Neonectria magnoliae]|uniref:Uncharacterized protein n=1 Tax=Neonectria magnoliae TaxID=2732573 RepID=A0ABR1HSH3_9HYPO